MGQRGKEERRRGKYNEARGKGKYKDETYRKSGTQKNSAPTRSASDVETTSTISGACVAM